MIIRKVFLGLDNGYSYVKTSKRKKVYASLLENNNEFENMTGDICTVNGKRYVLDKGGTFITDLSKTKSEYDRTITQVTTLAAICASFDGLEYADVDVLEVVLGVGLPISFFTEQKDEFINILKGCSGFKVSLNGSKEKIIKFEQIYAYPQSAAVAFTEADKFREAGKSLVIDWGWGTVDITAFDGIKPITNRYRTYTGGLRTVYGELASVLQTKFQVDVSKFDMEEYLKAGSIYVGDEEKTLECLDSVINKSVNRILENLTGEFNKEYNTSRKIFLIGGGFKAFKSQFEALSGRKNIELIADAQYANANAFEQIAIKKYKLENR